MYYTYHDKKHLSIVFLYIFVFFYKKIPLIKNGTFNKEF